MMNTSLLSLLYLYTQSIIKQACDRAHRAHFDSVIYALLRFNKTAKKRQVVKNCHSKSHQFPNFDQFYYSFAYKKYFRMKCRRMRVCIVRASQSAGTALLVLSQYDNPQSFTKIRKLQLMLQAQLLLLLYQLPSTPRFLCFFIFLLFSCQLAGDPSVKCCIIKFIIYLLLYHQVLQQFSERVSKKKLTPKKCTKFSLCVCIFLNKGDARFLVFISFGKSGLLQL